jgi:glycosyltransferase involved in cell wall biosynthesis
MDRKQLLLGAYAAVLPARWAEPFGYTTLETLATGTPVLGTAYGAFPEMVLPGFGWCIPFDLKQSGFTVAKTNDELALDMAVRGLNDHQSLQPPSVIRAGVEATFSAETMARNYASFYDKVLST